MLIYFLQCRDPIPNDAPNDPIQMLRDGNTAAALFQLGGPSLGAESSKKSEY